MPASVDKRVNPDRRAATELAVLLQLFLSGKLDRPQLAERMVKAAKWIGDGPAKPKAAGTDHTVDIIKVHGTWCEVMGQQARLTPGRRAKVAARLKSYSVAQICRAIRGCSVSDHHMGKNDSKTKYNQLELICRTDEKLEFFLRIAEERGVGNNAIDRKAERLVREADTALREGRLDDYERANQALAAHSAG